MKNFIVIILLSISSICYSQEFNGYWKGNFILKGSAWPMRLHIIQNDDSVKVFLDIPNLVFAKEPVKATIHKSSLKVTFPFGLGEKEFERNGDKLIPLNSQKSPIFYKDNKPPYLIETIKWKSGKEILQGSLYIPNSEGKHALLIRLHGSGAGNRSKWEYRSWGDYFARKGLATVVFDRRGEGESSSNSNNYNFNNLANDAITLIEELKKRSDIDTNQIILNGGSQAAYISFMVNAMCDDIDYMILSGASSVSIIEQERQSLLFRMRAKKESSVSINAAMGYQQLYFHYIMTGKNWKALEKSSIEAQSSSWAKYTDQPRNQMDLKWWRENYNSYQPEVLIPLVKVPTLIFFGENDLITPPSIMISQFEEYLKESNNDSFKMIVCPLVGHSLEVELGQDRWGNIIFPQRSPKMFSEIERWLKKFSLEK